MGNKFTRQEEYRIRKRLVMENTRRVFFVALVSAFVVPVMLLINSLSAMTEATAMKKIILISFEVFSLMTVGISYLSIRTKDVNRGRLVYRGYWLLFEVASGLIVYADAIAGAKLTFYSFMLAVIMLVPVMAATEQMYYAVIQGIFIIFLAANRGASSADMFNLILINTVIYFFSRVVYLKTTEGMMLNERMKDARAGSALDPVTGLLNRKGLEKNVFSSLVSCIRSRKRVSLLMIDVDELQKYNDCYGVDRGDECIKEVSETIRKTVLRNTNVICRLDGGSFLVYMEGGNDMEPLTLAEKVRSNIERKRIPHSRRAGSQFVTVSIGVASCIPKSESDFSELYDEAENSLIEAKERGRNLTIYDAQIYGQRRRGAI